MTEKLFDAGVSEAALRSAIAEIIGDGGGSARTRLIGLLAQMCHEVAQQKAELEVMLRTPQVTAGLQMIRDEAAAEVEPLLVTPRQPLRHISVKAAHLLDPRAGFHRLEWAEDGSDYRWIGPSPGFQLSLELDRTATYAWSVVIPSVRHELEISDIACAFGDVEAKITRKRDARGWVLSGTYKPQSGMGPVIFRCMAPDVVQASETDHRLICFTFASFSIDAVTA
jgi:hypothetical protein